MGNIINDIVNDVDIKIKPNKTKRILKWFISVSLSLIVIAFALGQFKSSFFNRMDYFENNLNKQTIKIEQLQTEITTGFNNIDVKINNIYIDGFNLFDEYQNFNKEQLLLVLDYGQTNKDLLKRMIELNTNEKTRKVKTQLEQAKIENDNIIVKPIKSPNYISLAYNIKIESGDTIFHLIAATKKYINNIDKNKYEVGAMTENLKHPNLYNVSYRNK